MDFQYLLQNAILNPDAQERARAEAELQEIAKTKPVAYLGMLTAALANEDQKTEVRMLAGIQLKNYFTSKNPVIKATKIKEWLGLDDNARAMIKDTSLKALLSPDERVASSAAQLVAALADMELPLQQWPELMPYIVENTKPDKAENVKRASLLAIGYICELADPTNTGVVTQSAGILTAIVQGAQSTESTKVRLAAINALVNSLEFIRYNFELENERNYIINVVYEAAQASDSELQASAFGALAKIMSLYYPFMGVYMEQALYALTIAGMKSTDERVACMAVEFWSTVCEEEIDLQELQAADEPVQCFNFALMAISEVLPTLLSLLMRQNEDPEDDDWSVAMAAGACLQLFAQDAKDEVTGPTLEFVERGIASSEWRAREAAVMAFGSILEGPNPARLKALVRQALNVLVPLIADPVLNVRDTVAWCLGRIADLVIDGIDVATQLPLFVESLLKGLSDHPKVSTNCCWAIMNLVEQLGGAGPESETTALSQYYESLVKALLQLSEQVDNEYASRASAYEALSTLVIYSANDVMPILIGLTDKVMERLTTTLTWQQNIVGLDDKLKVEEIQTNLLGLLTSIIRRVGPNVKNASDQLMTIFFNLLANKSSNSLIEEDIFIAIGAVAGAIGEDFKVYMTQLLPFLEVALEESELPACSTAVGLVADIAHALGRQLAEYCPLIMNILGKILNKSTTRKEVRPAILSCFGDVASSIEGDFLPYLEAVMQVLNQASTVSIEENNTTAENLDYFLTLREAILDAYVGIVGGLSEQPQAINPYLPSIFSFLHTICQDRHMSSSESICRSVVGLFGDIANANQNTPLAIYKESWITDYIKKTRSNPAFSSVTKDTARWAREQQKKQLSLQAF